MVQHSGLSVGEDLREYLRDFYGRRLKRSADFSQKACCTEETRKRYGEILAELPEEVRERHYGCGCPIPGDELTGLTALDLGSGAGVDAFILARRVGPRGFVYGVDMTPEQLEVARRWAPEVARRFGYPAPNTVFVEDYIEVAATVPDESIDLVVSDCVINLSPRKDLVFRTIRRVLKEGGEFFISDIVADRRLPESLRDDPELVAECLGGAMYEADWFDCMEEAGFRDVRVVERTVVQTEVRGEPVVFSSLTVRGFKFREPLDRRCEDYGQTAVYLGNVSGCEARFVLDGGHVFEAGRPTPVCRNTARILSETRLARYFEVTPPRKHFGPFRSQAPQPAVPDAPARSCC
ncbi:MAG TPA: methyltransferase domain-containing protein [Bryobacteraceae bacterium]|nr:methyltransferase domain-containing protein [Bryobacteraceae bacterium]